MGQKRPGFESGFRARASDTALPDGLDASSRRLRPAPRPLDKLGGYWFEPSSAHAGQAFFGGLSRARLGVGRDWRFSPTRTLIGVSTEPRRGLWDRLLGFLGLRKPPPDSGVREPRRPTPSSSGGVATVERPDTDES